MRLTQFALRRPITVIMVFSAVILIGFISWQRLSLELLPSINYPEITILTTHENAAPPEIESLVTKPIEEAVGTIKGVRRITSLSKDGISLVTLDFEWGTDTNLSVLDVREKLDAVKGGLPDDVDHPIIMKFDPASMPIVTLGLSGQSDFAALSRIASDDIKQKLERVAGVALARVGGGVEREVLVAVDQGRLYAYGIPLLAVIEKLKTANFNYPGGSIESGKIEIRIRTIGQFENLEDMQNIVLSKTDSGIPVFLKDVATISETFKDRTSAFLINGRPSIGISIYKQADANTVDVADGIIKEVNNLREKLTPRVTISIVYNQATFVKEAISDLELAGILGAVLAFIVLLLFLQSFQSALIITTAIPISVLGVFTLMYTTGLTLNIMSLGGLALGIGLLVDNGIVILENIHRHRETKPDVYQAVTSGTEEMQKPVIASTLAHIIVFLPILFVKGLAGKFFIQLALTISFSLIISILVALLLIPMLEARRGFFKSRSGKARNFSASSSPAGFAALTAVVAAARKLFGSIVKPLWRITDMVMQSAQSIYVKLILFALNNRKKILLLACLILVSSISLLPMMGKEFIPNVDHDNFDIELTMPNGTPLETTEAVVLQIGEQVLKIPEVKDVFINIGHDGTGLTEKAMGESDANQAKMTVILKENRLRSTGEIVAVLRPTIAKFSEIQAEYILNQNVGRMLRQKQAAPELFVISGPDPQELSRITREVVGRLRGKKFLKDVTSSLAEEEAEIQISVDREKAAGFGLTLKAIADSLKFAIQGEVATQYFDSERQVDIVVKLRNEDRNDISKLETLLIHTPVNAIVPLNVVGSIQTVTRLRQIQHHDQKRVSVISANIVGLSFGEAIENVKAEIEDIALPPNHLIAISSEQEQMNSSFQNLKFALLFSILLVYMLLASLFESFLNPFIIMFAVPLAAVGVILILFVFGKPISMGVYIGSIMLGGIVVNNSIILLDYAERLRKRGASLNEAILQAGKARLRPILMTASTTILGLVPLASGFGGGSEIRSPLALTVIGGLSTSTFMTLVIVPIVYSLVGDLKRPKTSK